MRIFFTLHSLAAPLQFTASSIIQNIFFSSCANISLKPTLFFNSSPSFCIRKSGENGGSDDRNLQRNNAWCCGKTGGNGSRDDSIALPFFLSFFRLFLPSLFILRLLLPFIDSVLFASHPVEVGTKVFCHGVVRHAERSWCGDYLLVWLEATMATNRRWMRCKEVARGLLRGGGVAAQRLLLSFCDYDSLQKISGHRHSMVVAEVQVEKARPVKVY